MSIDSTALSDGRGQGETPAEPGLSADVLVFESRGRGLERCRSGKVRVRLAPSWLARSRGAGARPSLHLRPEDAEAYGLRPPRLKTVKIKAIGNIGYHLAY